MSKIKRFFDIVFSGSYDLILTGLKSTFIIALGGLVIGIIIGCIVATFKVAGGRNKIARCISYIGDIYTGIFRGTPIVVQLLISHFVVFRTMTLDPVLESMLVFGLNSGAYVSEIMRGGILSVDIGQNARAFLHDDHDKDRVSAGDQKRRSYARQRVDCAY